MLGHHQFARGYNVLSSNPFGANASARLKFSVFISRPFHRLYDVHVSSPKVARMLRLPTHFRTIFRPVAGFSLQYFRCLCSLCRRATLCSRRSSKWSGTLISRHSGPCSPIICLDLFLHTASLLPFCFIPTITCYERRYPHPHAYLYSPSYHDYRNALICGL